LDGLPELVDICREACSEELTTYMAEEVLLPYDQFLEMLQMVAHDRADASTVENPPGRIRTALARAGRRKAFLDRQRSQQLTLEQSDGLTDLRDVESEVIADVDLERAKRDVALPPDQTRAVEARLNGVDLQAADANDYLGWDAARLKAVRRFLASDRRWGQRLRKRLSAYRRRRNSPKQP